MKFVMVQFPDTVDIATLTVDSAVTVTKTVPVAGGTVVMAGTMQNPPASTLLPHTHNVPAASGSVAVPASSGSVTVPAAVTGPVIP